MNNRQQRIIDILHDYDEWVTGKELASMLSVSDRTIRSDIEHINKEYECTLIEANRRKGYHLDEMLTSVKGITTKSVIPQTSQERVSWIIKELLFKQEINLIELQDRIYVSGYTIDNDLRNIRRILNEYPSLKVVRVKNHIRLEGKENEKRSVYKHLLESEIKGNFTNISALSHLWKDFNLIDVVEIFKNVCANNHYKFKNVSLPMLMMHAGIAIERIRNKNYLYETQSDCTGIDLEYRVSKDFFEELSQKLGIPYVEEEVVKFAFLLEGRGSHVDLKAESQQLVEEVLLDIKDCFDIDFRDDEELYNSLVIHMQSLLDRIKVDKPNTTAYLKEIKRQYPLVFEMAIHASDVISKTTGKPLVEDEISYLALHFGTAYERHINTQKYRVVMIIPHNQMLAKACMDKIETRFRERMEIIKVFPFFENNMISSLHPDLILTVVPLQHELSIKTVSISLFVNYEDESQIFQALNQLDREKYHDQFCHIVKKLIGQETFFIKKDIASKEDAINYLCDNLIQLGYATQEYKEDVFKREEMAGTAFVQGFAVPHAITVQSLRSTISVMVLKNPVKWGKYEVRLILLLSISEQDNQMLHTFFDWLSNVLIDYNQLMQFIEADNYQQFMKLMTA